METHKNKKIDNYKDQLDALRFISETHRGAREKRRTIETRVFFTTLSFYALIGAGKFNGQLKLPQDNLFFKVGAWFLLLIVAVFSSVHLLGLEAADRVNRELSQNAEMRIMEIVSISKPTKAGKWIAKTYYWQVCIIFVFAIVTGVALTFL